MAKNAEALARRYRAFAEKEASGISARYEAYARSVADSTELLRRLLTLEVEKRQPNLVFAATRHAVGFPGDATDFATHLLASWDAVVPVILTHATQTNEPARCACLLPALAQIDGPVAIIEVGAAAGLCLLPDHYGYDYGHAFLAAPDPGAPVFACRASPNTPIPASHPQIVWRAGLDLNPLDVNREADVRWLKALVWPEQTERLSRLDAALSLARRNPPRVVAGDLLRDTEALAAQAPASARLVIFHTAVLSYVAMAVRREFQSLVMDIGAELLANEAVHILPGAAPAAMGADRPGAFVLSRNGRAIARTGPHGQFVDWL